MCVPIAGKCAEAAFFLANLACAGEAIPEQEVKAPNSFCQKFPDDFCLIAAENFTGHPLMRQALKVARV